ncbi:kinase-like domain-containing protein [Mycena vitilis]|nr:kinase-like domain-containing protein [Mycena vitilis]
MTALLRQVPDTEQVNAYRPGGVHPVHIGDEFHDGRYEVKRRPGCGGYGTVWLVQDHVASGFAALKVMRADADRRELEILRHLKAKCADIDDYVVLGPSLAGIEDTLEDSFPEEVLPPDVVQSISLQIARGLARLHFADLTKRNILLCAPAFSRWKTITDVDEYLFEPETRPLRLYETGEPASPSPHRPSYTVHGDLPFAMTTACFADPANVRVKICDFGESFLVDAPFGKVRIPPMYVSPEAAILGSVAPPGDVWALAVIVHDLVVAIFRPLFALPWQSNDAAVAGAVLRLGTSGPSGPHVDIGSPEDRPFYEDDMNTTVSTHVSPERCGGDVAAFARVIRGMCDYDPARRTSAQVVENFEAIWRSRQDSDTADAAAPTA